MTPASGPLVLTLPFPPTVNRYWRHIKQGRFVKALISEQGRRYKEAASFIAKRQAALDAPIRAPVSVAIVFHPPDRRKRDLDNLPKALFDSITEAGVWLDDSQVREIRMKWGEKTTDGKAVVRIEEMEGADSGMELQAQGTSANLRLLRKRLYRGPSGDALLQSGMPKCGDEGKAQKIWGQG